jgi:hypothetical protein
VNRGMLALTAQQAITEAAAQHHLQQQQQQCRVRPGCPQ